MSDTITINNEKDYLRTIVRFVPTTLYKGNKEAETAIIRLCVECFEHGMTLQRDKKLEITL